jgi:hypothetical protein
MNLPRRALDGSEVAGTADIDELRRARIYIGKIAVGKRGKPASVSAASKARSVAAFGQSGSFGSSIADG